MIRTVDCPWHGEVKEHTLAEDDRRTVHADQQSTLARWFRGRSACAEVVQNNDGPVKVGAAARADSLLDEIVRTGARQMLAAALRAKAAGYVEANGDQLDDAGHRMVARNGYHHHQGQSPRPNPAELGLDPAAADERVAQHAA